MDEHIIRFRAVGSPTINITKWLDKEQPGRVFYDLYYDGKLIKRCDAIAEVFDTIDLTMKGMC